LRPSWAPLCLAPWKKKLCPWWLALKLLDCWICFVL
jgi:hypothetical protein